MSHNFESSGQKAFRPESPNAPAAEGETCIECGNLEDTHTVAKKTFLKRKVNK